jgi:hypothetical protein
VSTQHMNFWGDGWNNPQLLNGRRRLGVDGDDIPVVHRGGPISRCMWDAAAARCGAVNSTSVLDVVACEDAATEPMCAAAAKPLAEPPLRGDAWRRSKVERASARQSLAAAECADSHPSCPMVVASPAIDCETTDLSKFAAHFPAGTVASQLCRKTCNACTLR